MLKHKIEIYVPMNDLSQINVRDNVFRMFCKEFGGATINPVLGGWMDDKGSLITDRIGIVYSYVSEITPAVKKMLEKMAIGIRESLKEDAITMVIDGKVDFY